MVQQRKFLKLRKSGQGKEKKEIVSIRSTRIWTGIANMGKEVIRER